MNPERRRRQIRHDLVDELCRRLDSLALSEQGVWVKLPWVDGIGRYTTGGPNGHLEVQGLTLDLALERLLYALQKIEQAKRDYARECREEEEADSG